ncbi:unnamed protein product, partial [Caretta caretta]
MSGAAMGLEKETGDTKIFMAEDSFGCPLASPEKQ